MDGVEANHCCALNTIIKCYNNDALRTETNTQNQIKGEKKKG